MDEIWNMECWESVKAGSQETAASEFAKYNLYLMTIQEVGWDKGGRQPADHYIHLLLHSGSCNAN
jgi:hypothetical protein